MAAPQGVSLALGEATLATSPTWVRLDDPANPTLVASYQVDRGRPSETQRTSGATATIQINDRHGLLDPTNSSSPYFGEIEPLVQAAIARWNPVANEWDTRFRGFVAEYDYVFHPSQKVNQLQLTLVDIFEILQAIEMHPGYFGNTPPPDSVGQIYFQDWDSQSRIEQILGDCGIPSEFFVVFQMGSYLYPTVYSPGETALAAIQEATDAEFPELANAYPDRFGRLAVHGRQAVFDPVGVASGVSSSVWDWHEWHVGDGAYVAGSPSTRAQLRQFGFNHGRSFIVNSALAYPINTPDSSMDSMVVRDDGPGSSVEQFGIRSWTMPNLITAQGIYYLVGGGTSNTDAYEECHRFSEFKVANYKAPQDRITSLAFRPMHPSDPRAGAVHRLLGKIDISDRVDVTIDSPGGGGFDNSSLWYVQGLHEQVTGRLHGGSTPGEEGYDDVTLTVDVSPGPSDITMFDPP